MKKERVDFKPEIISFKHQKRSWLGVETVPLARLRQKASAAHLAAIQRVEFLMLILYTQGQGKHSVDFQAYSVQENTLIVVRPGTLHQFHLHDEMDGFLLVIDPQFMLPAQLQQLALPALLSNAQWPLCSRIMPETARSFIRLDKELAQDLERSDSPALLSALARQRLYTWLILLTMDWDKQDIPLRAHQPSDLMREFQLLLEQHFHQRWSVQDYAQRLGYAERTLTRACLAECQKTAKTVIDERIILEAKRLLMHGNANIENISMRLGFSDASPFVQFFKRLTQQTPQSFRLQQQQE